MNDFLEDERAWDWDKNPKQQEFIWDRSREAVWVAGRGGTKTSSTCFRILTTCFDIEAGFAVRPEWRGAKIAIFAPISKQLKGGPLEKFDEIFGDFGLITAKVNGHDPRRELAGGHEKGGVTVWAFNVAKDGSGVEATRGSEYAICWLDEAAQMPSKTYELSDTLLRQRHRNGSFYAFQLIITSTPRGRNWLDTYFMSKVPKGPGIWWRDKTMIIRSTTLESIECGFVPEGYGGKYLPGTLMYQQEKLGETISWGGLVFPEFDYTRHCHSPLAAANDNTFIVPPLHPCYGGVDPGTADPTCLLVGGLDERGGIWIVEEYYERRAKFGDWGSRCGEWDKKYAVREWEVDNDLTVRQMKNAGLRARTPKKTKDAAGAVINYINEKFSKNELHISPKCQNLIRELESYHHKEGESNDPALRGELTALGTIQTGQDDHACDALRYLILPLSSAKRQEQYGKEIGMAVG